MNDIIIAIGICIVAAIIFLGFVLYNWAKKQAEVKDEYETFEEVLAANKLNIIDQTKEVDPFENINEEDYKKLKERRVQAQTAVKMAPLGIRDAKQYVKGMIYAWVTQNLSMDKVKLFLGLTRNTEPDNNTIFEALMLKFSNEINYDKVDENGMHPRYGLDAFKHWVEKYHLNDPKPACGIASPGATSYYITSAELADTYAKEHIRLTDEEMKDILVTKIYQKVLGWGPFDTLAEMNINGYNIGVSGSLKGNTKQDNKADKNSISTATNSFWVYLDSAYIHLQFIDFGSEEEIRRISQLLIKYHSPGPLTNKNGAKVNTMHDKSRILCVRPDAGECWGVFVRKFSEDLKSPEQIVMKPGYKNCEMLLDLVEFIFTGKITTAVTGRQGSGKTVTMKSFLSFLPPSWNIRVLELAPELYLREVYPNREIYSAQETDYVSMEALQDFFKKSDATVTIIGEVATDPVTARMIQLAMTGSEMTVFSHHGKTAKDLVLTCRNSLVNACGFSNMQTAEKQVTDVLKLNIHLGFQDGKRYIERITEIVQKDEGVPYPEYDETNPEKSRYDLEKEYYYRQTDRISFTTHDILRFNTETDTYEVAEPMTDYLYDRIYNALPADKKKPFEQFITYYWGHKDKPAGTSIDGYTGSQKRTVDGPVEMTYVDPTASQHEAVSFLNRNMPQNTEEKLEGALEKYML